MKEEKLTFRKVWGHFRVVSRHRFKVFCLCCRVGIPLQGLLHDLSKYSPVEFLESARYFDKGDFSPIRRCKEVQGYSLAWIHHKNHNKHHYEYWYDYNASVESPVMPFRYFLEMICDSYAAGMTYQGDHWNKEYQLEYWNRVKKKAKIHPKMEALLDKVYTDVSVEGLDAVLNRKRLKTLYDEIIN